MTRTRIVGMLCGLMLLASGAALLTVGCSGGAADLRLNGAGSSFVYPMMSKWTSEYDKAKGAKINYQSIGSGAGIQQVTAKTIDFGCTDSPMNEEQLVKARSGGGEVVHIPLVMGAVVPIYNLPGVKEPLRFSGPVLADIYLQKIKKWNHPDLVELNPNVQMPDQDILAVHRSDGSGTTYIFVEYLSKVSTAWKQVGVGTSVNWPGGIGAKGSEGVSGTVRSSPGSISYVELTYALQNQLTYGVVRNQEGVFVRGNLDSVTAAAQGMLTTIPEDLRYSLTDAPGKDSYPLAGTVWAVLYVNQPPEKGKAIVDFLRWVTHEGQEFAQALDYARLPDELVKRVEKKLDQVK